MILLKKENGCMHAGAPLVLLLVRTPPAVHEHTEDSPASPPLLY